MESCAAREPLLSVLPERKFELISVVEWWFEMSTQETSVVDLPSPSLRFNARVLKYDGRNVIGVEVHNRVSDLPCGCKSAVKFEAWVLQGPQSEPSHTRKQRSSNSRSSYIVDQSFRPKHLGNRRRKNKHMTKHVRFLEGVPWHSRV